MRFARGLPLLLLLAAALSCQADVPLGTCTSNCGGGGLGGGGGGGSGGRHDVVVDDNFYAPSDLTVAAGDTIVWTWVGANQHSVTIDGGGDSGVHGKGFTIGVVVSTTTGVRTYHCSVHGSAVMSGTYTVK